MSILTLRLPFSAARSSVVTRWSPHRMEVLTPAAIGCSDGENDRGPSDRFVALPGTPGCKHTSLCLTWRRLTECQRPYQGATTAQH